MSRFLTEPRPDSVPADCSIYLQPPFSTSADVPWHHASALLASSTREEVMNLENSSSQSEGPVARTIEKQTAKLPSDLFLWAGVGSIVISLALRIFGKKGEGNFVATWVPTVLLLGVYNKIVKVAGHDRHDRSAG
jgi:hypothetical protein